MSLLIAYFSATGDTAEAAKKIAACANAEVFTIKPAVPYSTKDLDWTDSNSRTTVESRNPKAEVAIVAMPDMKGVDTLILGFPVWWYKAPTIIDTFLSKIDLNGLTIIPFCTSGGTSIETCESKLKAAFPAANWKKGLRLTSGTDAGTINAWLKKEGALK